MVQQTEPWEREPHREAVNTRESGKDESATGRDLPGGDGGVGDEQVHALDEGNGTGAPIGQDHSTDNHEEQAPDEGVGAVQDASLAGTDIADIDE